MARRAGRGRPHARGTLGVPVAFFTTGLHPSFIASATRWRGKELPKMARIWWACSCCCVSARTVEPSCDSMLAKAAGRRRSNAGHSVSGTAVAVLDRHDRHRGNGSNNMALSPGRPMFIAISITTANSSARPSRNSRPPLSSCFSDDWYPSITKQAM